VKSLLFVGYQFLWFSWGRLIHEIKNPTNNETWDGVWNWYQQIIFISEFIRSHQINPNIPLLQNNIYCKLDLNAAIFLTVLNSSTSSLPFELPFSGVKSTHWCIVCTHLLLLQIWGGEGGSSLCVLSTLTCSIKK
jgi:hypothetical protein